MLLCKEKRPVVFVVGEYNGLRLYKPSPDYNSHPDGGLTEPAMPKRIPRRADSGASLSKLVFQ